MLYFLPCIGVIPCYQAYYAQGIFSAGLLFPENPLLLFQFLQVLYQGEQYVQNEEYSFSPFAILLHFSLSFL